MINPIGEFKRKSDLHQKSVQEDLKKVVNETASALSSKMIQVKDEV